jgi:hypothetical protein
MSGIDKSSSPAAENLLLTGRKLDRKSANAHNR